MLWTDFLPVLGLSILYCLQAKKESSLLLASVGDDSDMKIVVLEGSPNQHGSSNYLAEALI